MLGDINPTETACLKKNFNLSFGWMGAYYVYIGVLSHECMPKKYRCGSISPNSYRRRKKLITTIVTLHNIVFADFMSHSPAEC